MSKVESAPYPFYTIKRFTDDDMDKDIDKDIDEDYTIDLIKMKRDNTLSKKEESTNMISKKEESTKDAPVLYNHYLFEKLIHTLDKELDDKKIRCSVCLDGFENSKSKSKYKKSSYYMCFSCSHVFHVNCASECGSKCPHCRYESQSSSRKWYVTINSNSQISEMFNFTQYTKNLFNKLLHHNDLPVGLLPMLEASHKGISDKVVDFYSSMKNEPLKLAIQKNLELSKYLMNKCFEINEAEMKSKEYLDKIKLEHKRVEQLRFDLQREKSELKRQTEIYNRCKLSLASVITDLDTSIVKETDELTKSKKVVDQIKLWDTKIIH